MSLPPPVISLAAKLGSFDDAWNPRIVARYNGNEVRVAKLDGAFDWHAHAATDELFLVVRGTLRLEFRDGNRVLGPGELCVVPAGVEHRPVAEPTCEIMLIDREGEPNTGVNPGRFTRAVLAAI